MYELEQQLPLLSPAEREAEKAALLRILLWSKEQLEELGAMHSATYVDQSIQALENDE